MLSYSDIPVLEKFVFDVNHLFVRRFLEALYAIFAKYVDNIRGKHIKELTKADTENQTANRKRTKHL